MVRHDTLALDLKLKQILRKHQQGHPQQAQTSPYISIAMKLKGSCRMQMLSPGQSHTPRSNH